MTISRELVSMCAQTEFMVNGVAKDQSFVGFSGTAMMLVVKMNDGTHLNATTLDWRTLTLDDIKGLVASLMRRVVELATTPKG